MATTTVKTRGNRAGDVNENDGTKVLFSLLSVNSEI